MKFTSEQLSERLGVTKVVANGLARHLVAVGKAKVAEGLKKMEGDKAVSGRPTLVYEVKGDKVTLDLSSVAPVSYSTGTRPRTKGAVADAA